MSYKPSIVKVVLIDDASLILKRLKTMIAPLENVDVLGSAGNVTDGLALIEQLRPDAIVLDLRLPDGNGIEILERVKKGRDAGAGVPAVIVLTAHPSPPVREKCVTLGADYFFDKALEFRQVAQALTTLANEIGADGGSAPVPNARQSAAGLNGPCKATNSDADGTDGIGHRQK